MSPTNLPVRKIRNVPAQRTAERLQNLSMAASLEQLESRLVMTAEVFGPYAPLSEDNGWGLGSVTQPAVFGPAFVGPFVPGDSGRALVPEWQSEGVFNQATGANGSGVTRLQQYWADNRFNRFLGSGFSQVIIDTGINSSHAFFGPDSNGDGVGDRIVYQWDFAENDAIAEDLNGHGSNVAAIAAGSNGSWYRGVATQSDIIALRVFNDQGGSSFVWLEQALQWVIANADSYNIATVNLSLGDGNNYANRQSAYNIGDELEDLAQMGVIVVSSAGNSYAQFNSQQGVAYPAADPNVISVGAVYAETGGGYSYAGGASASASPAGAVAPFSQRGLALDIFAPGAPLMGAVGTGLGVTIMHGTSQAAPIISGIVTLAQHLADEFLGRRLGLSEMRNLLQSSGTLIIDGDDEQDNVTNTNRSYRTANVFAMAEAILGMQNQGGGGTNGGGGQNNGGGGTSPPSPPPPPPPPPVNAIFAGFSGLTGGLADRRMVIDFGTLRQAADVRNVDLSLVTFRVESIEAGRLTINGMPSRAGVTVVRPGDRLVWAPPSGERGVLDGFTLRALVNGQAIGDAGMLQVFVGDEEDYGGAAPRTITVASPGEPETSVIDVASAVVENLGFSSISEQSAMQGSGRLIDRLFGLAA